MSTLLEGKRILVTGIITDASIAFHAAKAAQEAGATVVLTGFGRLSLVKRVAKRLPTEAPVIELDVQNQEHLDALADNVREHVDGLDGVLHSIGFAPMDALGGNFLNTPWSDVATAVEVSAYSFKSLAMACKPLLGPGSSLVGMDFDNSAQAWPGYDWMGVAKAALQATTRYLARDLGPEGIRANLVAAGPVRTMAAKSIPGFDTFEEAWTQRSPLGWDLTDPTPVAKTICALLSDYMPATTGEVIHADGGYHAMGA